MYIEQVDAHGYKTASWREDGGSKPGRRSTCDLFHRCCRLRLCRRGRGLLGPCTHLPALPLQPAHPLLAPLSSHFRGFGRTPKGTEIEVPRASSPSADQTKKS